ncbi:trimeric intracellular cation channel family protein [Anaerobacillus isosaccharinicus]|uniref:Trimeric intracellular cation channel family protein n=1 Tax=Anaerobacillus isosaccharinicus TaxID=1532552 RepID=A0A1S2LNJ1_9BACI|nr:trimeric intracellular cation channel family protein [Anaerobacillus isosaccharinicus]MBA5586215.1 trimeric intracellular cation channel family protein [Anaerobacillus isosaccharinicus]QOY35526.1 trimeric intracellular cation channel family protein [Anaerobacillus isosaccharinicus]
MTWEILTIIGTIAFALSGVIVAMEEDYDLMGVYILGLVTAFGGGAIRNLLIGVPVSALWEQGHLFTVALVVMTIAFFFPKLWVARWLKWGLIFDALGLAAFAIQGALYATNMGHPISAVIVAAALTGTGGGMIRDVLAGRKPLFLRNEIYIVWAMLAGLAIGVGAITGPIGISVLFVCIVVLRMLSVYLKWQLPHRRLG